MMAATAWGAGLATDRRRRVVLDTWYRWLGWGEFGDDGCPTDETTQLGMRDRADEARGVTVRPVRSRSTSTSRHVGADAYLRLHLLSHRLAAPRTLNLDGAFGAAQQRGVDQHRPGCRRRDRRRPLRVRKAGACSRCTGSTSSRE
jgi:2,3,4,5-tetrahydropyridine-2,6-dicarboxylate N-succinyltransferase